MIIFRHNFSARVLYSQGEKYRIKFMMKARTGRDRRDITSRSNRSVLQAPNNISYLYCELETHFESLLISRNKIINKHMRGNWHTHYRLNKINAIGRR